MNNYDNQHKENFLKAGFMFYYHKFAA